MLRDDSCNGHGDTNETVLEDCNPDDIEPSQTTSRCAQPAVVSSSAFLKVLHGPDPWLRLDCSEILFLLVQILSNIGTHQTEEGGNGEGFVTIS